MKKTVLLLLVILSLAGCTSGLYHPAQEEKTWQVQTTSAQVAENAYFWARIDSDCRNDLGCMSLRLQITNKSDRKLEVNWLNTYYIHNGRREGTFMPIGKTDIGAPDIIGPKGSFMKFIFPDRLATVDKTGKWNRAAMKPGKNGVALSIKVDGREINEILVLELKKP
jgi:uncharacterized protein YceK